MAETLIVVDDEDAKAGFFFKACQEAMSSYFLSKNITYSVYTSPQIHHTAVAAFAEGREKFILGAFSHGNSEELTKRSQPYISNNVNGVSLSGGFIYTFACSSGKVLGEQLTNEKGVLCYIGYSNKIHIWDNDYFGAFVECATIGLKKFFDGSSSMEIIELIKERINEEIDKIYMSNYLVAADLRRNRDSLVIFGKEVSLTDF